MSLVFNFYLISIDYCFFSLQSCLNTNNILNSIVGSNPVGYVLLFSHPSPIKLYTGGMPRASYGDRYTLTAMRDDKMVVFDFGSAIVDFVVVPSLQNQKGNVFS